MALVRGAMFLYLFCLSAMDRLSKKCLLLNLNKVCGTCIAS